MDFHLLCHWYHGGYYAPWAVLLCSSEWILEAVSGDVVHESIFLRYERSFFARVSVIFIGTECVEGILIF